VVGSIGSSRGMTGVHQMAAACDLARARAMKEQREVMLAFADPFAGSELAGRAVLMCAAPLPRASDLALTPEEEFLRQRESVLEPLSEWFHLAEGNFFAPVPPKIRTAGVNVLGLPASMRSVRLPGAGVVTLPCIGFGSMGEVVFPDALDGAGSAILIAISDRPDASQLSSENCRWIGIQRHSGAAIILP
jgi:hypothetical protein